MTDADLFSVSLDPGAMVVGSLLLIGVMFVPFYALSLIIGDPGAVIVQVFTWFPLTAPVTAMLRNALGTLDALTAGIVIAELCVLGILVLRLAVQLFRSGSIAYTDKLDLRAVLGRKGVSAGN